MLGRIAIGDTDHRDRDEVQAEQVLGAGNPAAKRPRTASRHQRSPVLRRLNYFWLLLIVGILVNGCVTAAGEQAVWPSWRGPAMVLLSVCMVGWYLSLIVISHTAGWPAPRRVTYGYLITGGVLVGLLLTISNSFVPLVFALMGMSASMLPLRENILPVGVAILMYLRADGLLPLAPGYTGAGIMDKLVSLATSVGIIYAITALVRERFEREQLFCELDRAHRELSEAHRRLRLSAAREADMATLRERNRLAREMHDSLGHALVSIAIKLEAVQSLFAVDAGRALAEVEDVTALVRATMSELRQSLAGLRPAPLEDRSLGCALAEMARDMEERTGVGVTCRVDEQAMSLDRDTQEALFRVAQEALTNVAKHAQASRVTLSLDLRDGEAILEVADDGIGLGATPRSGLGHYGILGMRERLEPLGGVLTLGPRPGGGTVARARVPVGKGL